LKFQWISATLALVAEVKPFLPVKLICGIIASEERLFSEAEKRLASLYGNVDSRSPRIAFNLTAYYESQMGAGLHREFLSFAALIDPSRLSEIKIRTNILESEISADCGEGRRAVNLDPGYLTPAALIMATAKDFSHRIPLSDGIYGHLEFLFTRTGIRRLAWTYPDFADEGYQRYFVELRRAYLAQLKRS